MVSNQIKKERNDELVNLYRTGNYKYIEIGEKYGITKERVRMLVTKYISKKDRDKILFKRKLNTWKAKQPK